MNTCSSFICNCQNWKQPRWHSTGKWMNKLWESHKWNTTSTKKKLTTDTCIVLNESSQNHKAI